MIIKIIKTKKNLIGHLHLAGLPSLGEVGSVAETTLGILDEAADLAPSLERLLRRVLRLHPSKVLIQISLHRSIQTSNFLFQMPPPPRPAFKYPIKRNRVNREQEDDAAKKPPL